MDTMLCFQALAVFVISLASLCAGDINSGCPSWGCLPWGSFSLSSQAPPDGQVKWSTLIESSSDQKKNVVTKKGCVSDQQTIVCATSSGYVSIDPSNGKKLWSYETRSAPYLPIMDIYGDVIGMDQEAMYYVGADGTPKQPIGVGILKPAFGLMIGNNSIMLLTGSTNKTAQIFTYGPDGVIDGAIPLTGNINRMNGTFVPCGQPIIAGSRAYVVTCFWPDHVGNQESRGLTGMMRLYAIDLLHQMAPRIKVAWYFNLGRWAAGGAAAGGGGGERRSFAMAPVVMYFSQTVYVNVAGSLHSDFTTYQDPKNKQPYPGTLWAIQDTGNEGKLVFRTSCLYGPMAVYDTYDKPINLRKKEQTRTSAHAVWTMNHSPAMLIGHDALNGSVLNVTGLDEIFTKQLHGYITSRLSITRSPESPDDDVLIFGMADPNSGQADLVAVQVSVGQGQARLLWRTTVAKPGGQYNTVLISGQIVNVALSYDDPNGRHYHYGGHHGSGVARRAEVTWKPGVVAMVTEMYADSCNTTIVAVF